MSYLTISVHINLCVNLFNYLGSENAMLDLKLQFRFEKVDALDSWPHGDGLKYVIRCPKALNDFEMCYYKIYVKTFQENINIQSNCNNKTHK